MDKYVEIFVTGGVCHEGQNEDDVPVAIVDYDDVKEEYDVEGNKDKVIVEGSGGVFEVVNIPDGVDVDFKDYDNEED